MDERVKGSSFISGKQIFVGYCPNLEALCWYLSKFGTILFIYLQIFRNIPFSLYFVEITYLGSGPGLFF